MRLAGLDLERALKIERHFRLIYCPGDLIEIRGFPDESTGRKGTAAGLFNDFRRAAHTAMHMSNAGLQTYHSLNPILPGSSYAKHQRLNTPSWRVSFAVTDNQISCRRLYLFDFDPDRPGFKKSCSTDAERATAWVQAQQLRQYLAEQGWPEPIVIDSGNGYHFLYRDWGCAVGREATADVAAALRYLKTKFPLLDSSVFNPGRIARVPYTVNRKGVNTTERRHRRAYVVSYPEGGFEVVGSGKIYHLAIKDVKTDEDGKKLPSNSAKRGSNLLIDEQGVQDLIDEYPDHLELDCVSRRGAVTYFALAECPFKGAAHHDQDVGLVSQSGSSTFFIVIVLFRRPSQGIGPAYHHPETQKNKTHCPTSWSRAGPGHGRRRSTPHLQRDSFPE
jgi:hypothetical protein